MKALSIKQPWVFAITDLGKRVENRTWPPPLYVIGEYIAIHASKGIDSNGYPAVVRISGGAPPIMDEIVCGAIVATARIVGWLDEKGRGNLIDPSQGHMVDDPWFMGPIGWLLDDVRKVGAYECKGRLGLWNVPSDIAVKISEETDGRE